MPPPENARRKFLRTAGAGLAGGALIAVPKSAFAEQPAVPRSVYDVTSFGATGDGKTLDTEAINRAIEAAATAGGGIVALPAGKYLCYSLRLKSYIDLHVSCGATIVAADPPESGGGYDLPESNQPWENYQDFGHNHWHNSLIWGEGLEGVSISGTGLIWGRGLSRGWGSGPKAEQAGVGNKAIALKDCRNVLLRDFSILHGGHFGILATGVDNLTISNLKIDTNRDGMDIDCCRNVRIASCSVNSPWDDAICLKSSFALGYARATEMVTISDCLVTGNYEEGTLLDASYKRFSPEADVWRTGRIKLGTESNGGFNNITIGNCVFEGCMGLAIESVDGAVIEDVAITNITMRDVVGAPIFLRLGARMRGPAEIPVGALRRVTISNLSCLNAPSPPVCSIVSGIPGHCIEDLRLCNITVRHHGGGSKNDAARQLPEKEKDYPEPTMFGTTPAQGFFVRHVRGLEVDGIRIESENPDERPVFVLDDIYDAGFSRVKISPSRKLPTFTLDSVREFSLFGSRPLPDTELATVEHREL
jgi:polygalacturonase